MSTQGILGDFGRLFFCPQFNQHHGTYMGAGLLAIAECQSMHSLMTRRNRGQARTPMNCTRLESGGIKKGATLADRTFFMASGLSAAQRLGCQPEQPGR